MKLTAGCAWLRWGAAHLAVSMRPAAGRAAWAPDALLTPLPGLRVTAFCAAQARAAPQSADGKALNNLITAVQQCKTIDIIRGRLVTRIPDMLTCIRSAQPWCSKPQTKGTGLKPPSAGLMRDTCPTRDIIPE